MKAYCYLVGNEEKQKYCPDCGTQMYRLNQQVAKKKDKRTVCLKCGDIATGKRDKRGFLK